MKTPIVIPIELLQPYVQPRTAIAADGVAALAESIRAFGLFQPLVVAPIGAGRFGIVQGERRWRASQLAGLRELPCFVHEGAELTDLLAGNLTEQVNRVDLNPMDLAEALARIKAGGITDETIGRAILQQKSRNHVTQILGLMRLPALVQGLIRDGELSFGHGKALTALPHPLAISLGQQTVARGWSVRQLERQAQQLRRVKRAAPVHDGDIARLEQRLSEFLCAPVRIARAGQHGFTLTLSTTDLDTFEGSLQRMGFRLEVE